MTVGRRRTGATGHAGGRRQRMRTEVRLGLDDVRCRLGVVPVSTVWQAGKDAAMRGRSGYADGVRAGFGLAGDGARMRAWDLGYAAGEEDAADERRAAAARGGCRPAGSSPLWLLA